MPNLVQSRESGYVYSGLNSVLMGVDGKT